MINYQEDALQTRYIGGREQDNEGLALADEMRQAEAYDNERMASAIGEQAVEQVNQKEVAQSDNEATETSPDNEQAESSNSYASADSGTPMPDYMLPNADGTQNERPQVDPVMESDGLPSAGVPNPDESLPNKEETTLKKAMDVSKYVLTNAPKNITVGVGKGLVNAIEAVAHGLGKQSDDFWREVGMGESVDVFNDFFENGINETGASDKVVQELSGFMFAFGGYMKVLGGVSKASNLTKGFAADALASYFNVDPHMERLASVAQELGYSNEMIDYMADQSGTDAENRLRNVLEGQVLGGTIFAVAKALKGTWWTAKALKAHHDKVGTEEFLLGSKELREKGSVSLGGLNNKYPLADKDEWYGEANYLNEGGTLKEMSPDEFLARAKPLEIDDVARENIDYLKKHMTDGRTLDPLTIYKDDVKDVRASDGRHRAIAAKELGMNKVPVVDYQNPAYKLDVKRKVGGPDLPDDLIADLNNISPDIDGFLTKKDDGTIVLEKLTVEEQNKGSGTKFMEKLVQYADDNNTPLALTAAGDFGGSKAKQMKFYKKFGFVENKGKNKDYAISENMIRNPKGVK